MDTVDFDDQATNPPDDVRAVRCAACDRALRSPGRDTISFLLFDQFTIPLVGCRDHLEQFSATCELTTEADARLLGHRPAGGVRCPGCRHAARRTRHPVLPVGTGAIAVLACATHQDDVIGRFRAGLQIRQHLTASL
jgi:hypothetical protein